MQTEIVNKPAPKRSLGVKIVFIGVLMLLLLIPIGLISYLIHEREDRSHDVVNEISRTWGMAQNLVGPVLVIPYEKTESYYSKGIRYYRTVEDHAYFLPESLQVAGHLESLVRKRSIYEALLYKADLTLNGEFKAPDFDGLGVSASQIKWNKAKLILGLSDMKALQERSQLQFGEKKLTFEAATMADVEFLSSGLEVPLDSFVKDLQNIEKTFSFSMPLKFRGSGNLSVSPMSKETKVDLSSDWPHPSFDGTNLPDSHNITDKGYEAKWKVFYLGRGFAQRWLDEDVNSYQVQQSSFGVSMVKPVDIYQSTMRSVKYAILFVMITFGVFFLFEVMLQLRIHPMQYIFVGVGLTLFYLLLLSLSEHIPFVVSYIIATCAIVGMLTGYSYSILKTKKHAGLISSFLLMTYGFLYILLQAEDLALLLGSIGLFNMLAFAMYITRKIDWYNLSE